MPTTKLTPKKVSAVVPRPGRDRDTFFDKAQGAPTGFALRVSGDRSTREWSRAYYVVYRAHGRLRWYRIGDAADLGLSEAREIARDALLRVAQGGDPAARRREVRSADDLAALVLDYIEHGADERSDRTTDNYRRQQRALARSAVGGTPVLVVTRAEVRAYVERLAKDAPVQANRMLALIRAACRWALGRDLLANDPTAGLRMPGAEDPTRTRLDDPEIVKLWKALDDPKAALAAEVRACVRVMLLLGTRRTETTRMRWADLDLDAEQPTWTIPREDRKGGRALVVPLPALAVELIKALPRRHEYVFAGKRGGPLSSNPNRWSSAVKDAAGVEFSPHVLRRTFARGVARLGTPSELVSRLLGHKLAAGALAVTEGYAEYDFLTERASALSAWAAHVQKILKGEERATADVTPISKGRRRRA
jgi:integrase